ncbi:MAG: sensor histidine kinase [Spirochaetota bacterium]
MQTDNHPPQEDTSRYVLGHKLSNLLTPVVGMAHILSTKAADCGNKDAERLARTIHDAAQVASRLLSLFIRTRDIETGTQEPSKRPGDLSLLLGSVLHDLEATIEDVGAKVDLTTDGSCRIMMDCELLPAAFRYLIEGTLHDLAAEPELSQRLITIQVERAGNEALVVTRYNAGSIGPHRLERFFDPTGAPANAETGRTGLEYSYARAVVEAHGGRASVASPEPGVVLVTVVLPADEERGS